MTDEKSETRPHGCPVRRDLVGKAVKFDGEHFIVDFKRRNATHPPDVIARASSIPQESG
jgi:hypothetical protein